MLDIDPNRIDKVNNLKSTIADPDIDKFLSKNSLALTGVLDDEVAYKDADFIIIATPTNYDPDSNQFNTSSVDGVVDRALAVNKKALIVIKSTIPVGHTEMLQKHHKTNRIIFSPEFLREGRALYDNLFPSRIIIGSTTNLARINQRPELPMENIYQCMLGKKRTNRAYHERDEMLSALSKSALGKNIWGSLPGCPCYNDLIQFSSPKS